MAITELKLKIMAIKNPIIGKKISWLLRPIIMALGYLIILVKSLGIRFIPMPSIIIPRAAGKNTLVISSSRIKLD
jgi:hypothetical protein